MSVSPAKMVEPIKMPFEMWTQVGPRNHLLDGVQIPFRGAVLRAMMSGFSGMLSTNVLTSQPQKQLSVTLSFPSDKSPCVMRPLIKIFYHLFLVQWFASDITAMSDEKHTVWFCVKILLSEVKPGYHPYNVSVSHK